MTTTFKNVTNEDGEFLVTHTIRVRQTKSKAYPFIVEERSEWLAKFGGKGKWEEIDRYETEAEAMAAFASHVALMTEQFAEWTAVV